MPLARIFTRNPERTADLSSQLQQQGYKIEVVSPDQKHLAPADLEIEFEICERADVLERAADLASELEADVAVGPGILQAVPEPIAPLSVQAAAQAVAPSPVEMKPAEQKLADEKTDLEREFEAAFSSNTVIPAAMPAEVIEIPVMEHAPLPPVAFAEDAAAMMEPVRIKDKPIKDRPIMAVPVHFSEAAIEPTSIEPTSVKPISVEPFSVEPVLSAPIQEQVQSADPMPYLAQLTPFSSPAARQEQSQASSAALKSEARAEVRQSEKAAQAAERGKQVLQDGAKIAAKTWAGALALSSSTADTVRDQFRVYKKRAQVRSAEQRAAQAAKMLDLEQRRAEAQQRTQELEAARIAASVRLTELLQQREPGLPKQSQRDESLRDQSQLEHGLWQPSTYAHTVYKDDMQSRDVAPVTASAKQAPPLPPASRAKSANAAIKTTPAALWSKVTPPFRAVLTGAAAVSALFIMGIALGVFHSHDPLASPANHASASNGSAAPSGATTQTGEAAPVAQAKPQPGTESQPDVRTEAKAQSPAKPSPRVQRAAQLVSQQAETNIGDDVVIRRFSRPVPTQQPKQAGQQAGLKHFSDLDN
jgi:hypothetical protein